MKKIISMALIASVLVLCFALFPSAEGDITSINLKPSNSGAITTDGCTVTENDDGSVVITLTKTTGTVDMSYTGDSAISIKLEDVPYLAFWYLKDEDTTLTVHMIYDREDKVNADLFLDGMIQNPDEFKTHDLNGTYGNYGVWDWFSYLNKESKIPADGMIPVKSINYTFTGDIGDEVIIYSYDVVSDYAADFGQVNPNGDNSTDESSNESSEDSMIEESSDYSSESSATVPTGDNGFIAFAVIAIISVAGIAIVKKVR